MEPSPLRLGFVLCALVLIWAVWRPVVVDLPTDVVFIADAPSLAALPEGRAFLFSGSVRPVDQLDASALWHERFAYVRRERRDLSGGSGKHTAVVTIAQTHPALWLEWAGGRLGLPAESYDLSRAPIVREDGADVSSTGLRAGDAVLALGRLDAHGIPRVEHLMEAPLETLKHRLARGNRTRAILTLSAKIVLSVFALSLLLRRGAPAARVPA